MALIRLVSYVVVFVTIIVVVYFVIYNKSVGKHERMRGGQREKIDNLKSKRIEGVKHSI